MLLFISKEIFSEEIGNILNEPVYFILGKNGDDIKARFQFSFKYKIFDDDWSLAKKVSWFKNLYFAYTQTSLWNINASSSPFEDSSYRPSIFWEKIQLNDGFLFDFIRLGFEHESNGQGGYSSRSIDTLFILPLWVFSLKDYDLFFGSKIYIYTSKGRFNKDIEKYRGYRDIIIGYIKEDGWMALFQWWGGYNKKNTLQLDLSYPIRKKIFSRVGGYFYLQYFYGYGETILKYNEKVSSTIRFGFGIVR